MAVRGLVFALAAASAHGAGTALVEGTTRLTPDTFNGFVQDAIDSGKTAMELKNDPNVVWGDVNLREAQIRTAADGTPLNPGMGGWPTLRYFNAETGVGGAVVEQKTSQKICDEFKVPERMVEATKECMKMCNAATGAGCDEEQLEYINTWKGQGADAVAAEVARIEDLLSEETQKKMKKQTKLLAKVSKLAHDEL